MHILLHRRKLHQKCLYVASHYYCIKYLRAVALRLIALLLSSSLYRDVTQSWDLYVIYLDHLY
jgi:hypothetical protein